MEALKHSLHIYAESLRGQHATRNEIAGELDRLAASLPSPDPRPTAQPVAWLVSCPDDEIYGRGPDKLQFHPLAQHDIDNGYRAKPLYATPQPLPEGEPSEVGKWAIDSSTDSPILTYEKCSVIQDEQAHYVMSLIRRDVGEPSEAEVRQAGDILMQHGLNAPEQVIYGAARALLASKSKGGQADG